MNKQELKDNIELLTQSGHPYLGHVVRYEELMILVDNLDEPEITTEQAWEKIAEKYDKSVANVEADFEDWINSGRPQTEEKPEIPKFVADWIEEVKQRGCGLADALNYFVSPIMPEKVKQWIQFDFAAIGCHHDNQELLAKAWLNGYTIEKEPVWVVRINGKLYFCSFTDKYFEKDSDAPTYIESGNPSLIKKFTNKDKAEAVATLVDGTVKEWSE